MADPFSIVAGTISVADICFRVVRYLTDIQKAAVTIEDDIAALIHEVEALGAVNRAIRDAFKDDLSLPRWTETNGITAELWMHTGKRLQDCQKVVEKLEFLIGEIYGKTGPNVGGVRDGFGKSRRKRSKGEELRQCRDQLSTYQTGLQILLTTISLHNSRETQGTTARSFDDLSQELQHLDRGLRSQIATLQGSIESSDRSSAHSDRYDEATLSALKELRGSIDSAAAAVTSVSTNHVFDIPQPVSSIFTGREAFLKELGSIFIAPPAMRRDQQQRRFVIYGVGGSGKTQFCSKFAQDNRDSFWGVFCIDASTPERIKQSLSQIAKIAGVEPNENAAMHWLSNMEQRWLLIIDNADDPRMPLENYFPKGNRGHILVTTRNPAHKVHGNVGPGFFDFHGLDSNDANDLLLKAARQPLPWDSTCSASAATVTKALGYLALAITHAGAVIRDGLCSLKNYLNFYEGSWQRIRRIRAADADAADETDHMSVYATYEICYHRIESKGTEAAEDAIQLLKTFAFLHSENIRLDILKKAVTNRTTEAEQEEKDRQKGEETAKQNRQTWSRWIKGVGFASMTYILKERSPPVLPSVIRDAQRSDFFDDVRIRYALRELVQMSLVTHNGLSDSYSMHPLVHKWARERPGMSLAEQAIWSEAAATILASSLLLPPLGGSTADEDFKRDVLPHVDHVRLCQESINQRIAQNRRSLRMAWLVPTSILTQARARMYAKFSLVYVHCGRWQDAEQLQREVKDYAHKVLGPEHSITRRITLALSGTYFNLGRGAEAAELQRAVVHACNRSLGLDHQDTLLAKDILGQTLWQQGRYTEARSLHEEAVTGLSKLLGRDHQDTLNAIDNLGRTVAKFWERKDFEEARELHSKAVNGMEKVLGPDHPRTLIARENLARVTVYIGGDSLIQSASNMIDEVLEQRRAKLGKEHPYTLLAMVNAAIIKSALGELKEAEHLILSGLPIAERNLGADHVGTLFGRHTLGSILIQQRRYEEAETILVDVTERQRHMSSHRGDFHPDRLGAMIELAKCYRLQGKLDRSLRLCDEALEGFETISVREHPLARALKEGRRKMVEYDGGGGHMGDSDDVTAEAQGPYNWFYVF